MTEEEFERQFTKLIVEAMSAARDSDTMRAAIVEIQARSLGRGIALMCEGNAEVMSTFLEGAIHYAETEASGMVKVAKLIAEAKRRVGR